MDASGGLLSQNRYMPFGEVRDISGVTNITQTDFGYTGQRNLEDIGLMDYKARFYSPTLMRFIQPDTIVPSSSNPQSMNRYTYVYDNPLSFTDPSGHRGGTHHPCRPGQPCHYRENRTIPQKLDLLYTATGFSEEQEKKIREAVKDVAQALADELNQSGENNYSLIEAWMLAYGGPVQFNYGGINSDAGGSFDVGHFENENTAGELRINLYTYSINPGGQIYWMENIRFIIHELGHAFDYANGLIPSGDIPDNLLRDATRIGDTETYHIRHQDSSGTYFGYAGGFGSADAWQFGFIGNRQREEFADMFVGWVYNNTFNSRGLGPQRAEHMITHMGSYIYP
jgi:RHS repeat-associated protein